ncbi:PKD domain-containing protein [Candidatus Woesearchaeota archaeon]|nr:PKD domain-containing protein [Candidatus Woesearchaeota archaeon]
MVNKKIFVFLVMAVFLASLVRSIVLLPENPLYGCKLDVQYSDGGQIDTNPTQPWSGGVRFDGSSKRISFVGYVNGDDAIDLKVTCSDPGLQSCILRARDADSVIWKSGRFDGTPVRISFTGPVGSGDAIEVKIYCPSPGVRNNCKLYGRYSDLGQIDSKSWGDGVKFDNSPLEISFTGVVSNDDDIDLKIECDCPCPFGLCCDNCQFRDAGEVCGNVPSDCLSKTGADYCCDKPEVCDGATPGCPPDNDVQDSNYVCRNPKACTEPECCDLPEKCDGLTKYCPTEDKVKDEGVLCKTDTRACYDDGYCDGEFPVCLPNPAPKDTPCTTDDGKSGYCDLDGNCNAGCSSDQTSLSRKSSMTGSSDTNDIPQDLNDQACCDSAEMCVYAGACYLGTSDRSYYLNALGINDVICRSNTWHDCDYKEDYCTGWGVCSIGIGRWIKNGEEQTIGEYNTAYPNPTEKCCGDDAGEKYVSRNVVGSDSDIPADADDVACCSSSTDCVYDGKCYDAGSTDPGSYCKGQKWNGGDDLPEACPLLGGTWDAAMAAGSQCCGDDEGETPKSREGDYADLNDEACCGSDECVLSGGCKPYLATYDLSSYSVLDDSADLEVCMSSGWKDPDFSQEACQAVNNKRTDGGGNLIPTLWMAGGECGYGTGQCDDAPNSPNKMNFCCGDDPWELFNPARSGTKCFIHPDYGCSHDGVDYIYKPMVNGKYTDDDCCKGTCPEGGCCDKNCNYLPDTHICREAASECDVAEKCTGTSPDCPDNAFEPIGTEPPCGKCDGAGNCGECLPTEFNNHRESIKPAIPIDDKYPYFPTLTTDKACCSEIDDCVYDGKCYASNSGRPEGSPPVDIMGAVCYIPESQKCPTCIRGGTWYDCDNDQSFCTNNEWGCSLNWVASGEAGVGEYGAEGTMECCGDDFDTDGNPQEFFKVIKLGSDSTLSVSGTDKACCNSGNDCVENYECYDPGRLHKGGKDYCNATGGWEGGDNSEAACTAITKAAGRWDIDFESSVAATGPCCGDDDATERFVTCDIDDFCSDTAKTACCDNTHDCVFDGVCHPAYDASNPKPESFLDMKNGLPLWDTSSDMEVCIDDPVAGRLGWKDPDDYDGACSAVNNRPNPTRWMSGADTSCGLEREGRVCDDSPSGLNTADFCCGDDEGEVFREEEGFENACLVKGGCYFEGQHFLDGEYSGDNYCQNGEVIQRTKLIALQLLDIANKESPSHYTLFCDSYENALNYYSYDLNPPYSTSAFPYTDKINNVCLLRLKDQVIFGTSLDDPIDEGAYPFINVLKDIKSNLDCSSVQGVGDWQFHSCNTLKVWYNDKIQSVIYSNKDLNLGNLDFDEKFLLFLKNPFQNIFDSIISLFGESKVDPEDYGFLKDSKKFSRIYLDRTGVKSIKGVIEDDAEAGEYLSIAYNCYTDDICETVEAAQERFGAKGIFGGDEISCSYKPDISTYYVASRSPTRLDMWPQLTAGLRTKNVKLPTGLTITPRIKAPEKAIKGYPVEFQADVEGACISPPYTYSWTFGDAGTGSGEAPTHAYTATGSYIVGLTVEEQKDASNHGSGTHSLEVIDIKDCEIRDKSVGCDAGALEQCIMSLSAGADATADEACDSVSPYELCCQNIFQVDTAPGGCGEAGLISLSQTFNGRADGYNQGTFANDICIRSAVEGMKASCRPVLKGDTFNNLGGEVCVLSLSAFKGGVISGCDPNAEVNIYCRIIDEAVNVENCENGENDDGSGLDDCENAAYCPTGTFCNAEHTQRCTKDASDNRLCECIDNDGDGYGACAGADCNDPATCDCNDGDPSIHPGAAETCDNVDEDCDKLVDEGVTKQEACSVGCPGNKCTFTCSAGAWTEDLSNAYNGATLEVCDALDNDCDGEINEGVTRMVFCGDYGVCKLQSHTQTCNIAGEWVPATCDTTTIPNYNTNDDCSDTLDNDCDNSVNEDGLETFYKDGDSDGYGLQTDLQEACAGSLPAGYVASKPDGYDCNDGDWRINPGKTETCDGLDNDCDSTTADGSDESWFGAACDGTDADQCADGFYVCTAEVKACTDDAANRIEVCDGDDNDCDGLTDENVLTTYYQDADGDGYGKYSSTKQDCTPPVGYVASKPDGYDCDDTKPGIHPGATETCDGLDNNCVDGTDEGCDCVTGATRDCGASNTAPCKYGKETCVNGAWSGSCIGNIDPATEICDGVDNDCDGSTDETYSNCPAAYIDAPNCKSYAASTCSSGSCTAQAASDAPDNTICEVSTGRVCKGGTCCVANLGQPCLNGYGSSCVNPGTIQCDGSCTGWTFKDKGTSCGGYLHQCNGAGSCCTGPELNVDCISTCGNGVCDSTESCNKCPEDCPIAAFSASGTGCAACPLGSYAGEGGVTYCKTPIDSCLTASFRYRCTGCAGSACCTWVKASCFVPYSEGVPCRSYTEDLMWKISSDPSIINGLSCAPTCPQLLIKSEDGTLTYQNNIIKGNILPNLETLRFDKFRQRIQPGDKIVIHEAGAGDVTYLNSLELVGYKSLEGKTEVLLDQSFNPVGFNQGDLVSTLPETEIQDYLEYNEINLDGEEAYLYLTGGITSQWTTNLREVVMKKLAHPKLYELAPGFVDLVGTNLSFYANIVVEVEKNGVWQRLNMPKVLIMENHETAVVRLPAGASRVRTRTILGMYQFDRFALLPVSDADPDIEQKTFTLKDNAQLAETDGLYSEIEKDPLEIDLADFNDAEEIQNYDNFYLKTSGYYLYGKRAMEDMESTLMDDLVLAYRLNKIKKWLSSPEEYMEEIMDFAGMKS